MGKWKLFFPGPPCLIIHLSFFHLVNYVCHMSVVLWYLLIGLLVNVSSGITGTDMVYYGSTSLLVVKDDFDQSLFQLKKLSGAYGICWIVLSNVSLITSESPDLCLKDDTLLCIDAFYWLMCLCLYDYTVQS
jgi:hypothetical protein